MSGIITGKQFWRDFPACDERVQGSQRAALLQATYTAIYEVRFASILRHMREATS